MNRRMLILFVIALFMASILGCGCGLINLLSPRSDRLTNVISGSANLIEEERQVSGITGVKLATTGKLTIKVGDKEELRIKADDNILEYIETDVNAGILEIKIRDFVSLRPMRPINYYLTVKELDEIIISSSGDIEAPNLKAQNFSVTISSSGDLVMGNLAADALEVRISSSGDMNMGNLIADKIDVNITSSGNLDITGGEVEEQNITISSSGNYRAGDLESTTATVNLSSSGSATMQVNDYLKAHLSSSGDVRYFGNPRVVATTSSSGDVEQIDE